MRHRITYILEPDDDFRPQQLAVTPKTLDVTRLRGAKEYRWTIGLSELPREVCPFPLWSLAPLVNIDAER